MAVLLAMDLGSSCLPASGFVQNSHQQPEMSRVETWLTQKRVAEFDPNFLSLDL